MNEKAYKVMNGVGISSVATGIVVLAVGVAAGVLMIINGARLLKRKSDLLF